MGKREDIAHIGLEFSEEERHYILSGAPNLVLDADNIYPLTNQSEVAQLVLKAFKVYVLTNKDLTDDTEKAHNHAMQSALTFLNCYAPENLGHNVIKKMEEWEINIKGLKPQSTMCRKIRTLIDRVQHSSLFERHEQEQLKRILLSFTSAKDEDSNSHTLTKWFVENSPWLRQEMGEHFLLLESPKRLMISFEVTIATMLIYVLDARKELNAHPELLNLYQEAHKSNDRIQQKAIARLLAESLALPQDKVKALGSFIITETIPTKVQKKWEKTIAKCKEGDAEHNYDVIYQDFLYKFASSIFIPPKHIITEVNEIESTLMAWLCSTLAIQASDVGKLTRRHVAMKKNRQGIVRQIEIDYYKGRADRVYKPHALLGSSVLARAILAYLDNLPKEQDKLFANRLVLKARLSNPYRGKLSNQNSFSAFFAKTIMDSTEFAERHDHEHQKVGSGKIFNFALSLMYQSAKDDFSSFRKITNNREASHDEYRAGVEKPLPISFFGLTHLKNSSVHSRSDRYRDGDLINQNSHTPLTEKLSYLTDDNKDWVNQVGRITRMVMQDIESKALQPMIEYVDRKVYEKSLRTKVIQNTSTKDAKINQYGEIVQASKQKDLDHVIVFENEQTAITMLHYIDQASENALLIQEANQRFFEDTLLINVEWMHYCLSKFDPKLVSQTDKTYQGIKSELPKLFENEINAGISL